LPLPHPNSFHFSHHKPLVSIGASCNNFFNHLILLKWSLEVVYGPLHINSTNGMCITSLPSRLAFHFSILVAMLNL
jgi:hypothetical protein